jgi:hypothetical protein
MKVFYSHSIENSIISWEFCIHPCDAFYSFNCEETVTVIKEYVTVLI